MSPPIRGSAPSSVLPSCRVTSPLSVHRLPRPYRTPARPSASARQPHRPPSQAPPRPAASMPLLSPPNPPRSKVPAQLRHSASPSCRRRFLGRAVSMKPPRHPSAKPSAIFEHSVVVGVFHEHPANRVRPRFCKIVGIDSIKPLGIYTP